MTGKTCDGATEKRRTMPNSVDGVWTEITQSFYWGFFFFLTYSLLTFSRYGRQLLVQRLPPFLEDVVAQHSDLTVAMIHSLIIKVGRIAEPHPSIFLETSYHLFLHPFARSRFFFLFTPMLIQNQQKHGHSVGITSTVQIATKKTGRVRNCWQNPPTSSHTFLDQPSLQAQRFQLTEITSELRAAFV